jgi:hypothetical protein
VMEFRLVSFTFMWPPRGFNPSELPYRQAQPIFYSFVLI